MVSWSRENAIDPERPVGDPEPFFLECVVCGTRSLPAAGWRGVQVDLPNEGDAPALGFYCPPCAEREFGS